MAVPFIQDLMSDFHSELGQDRLQEIVRQFHPQKGLAGMFRLLWDLELAHKCLTVTLVEKKKSEAEAIRLQKLGDDYFQEKNLKKALEMYNQSLIVAPHPPVDTAGDKIYNDLATKKNTENGGSSCGGYELLHQSYRKRSAVLYELEHYDRCLLDIMLTSDCPNHKNELEERKQICLAKLGNRIDNKICRLSDCLNIFEENVSAIPKLSKVNPTIPCFSSACKIAYAPERGRYIVANEAIRPGDILLVEKAYSTSLYEERHSVQCTTCLRECLAPVPCSECTMAVFCSPSCRLEGLSGAHRLECPVLPTLYAMDMMPFFGQAYKLLSMGTCTQWKDILKRVEERASNSSPVDKGKNESGIYNSDFEAAHNLVTNVEERSRGDLYAKCLIAFVLTKILQLSGRFFVDDLGQPVTPPEEDLVFAGQFLFGNQLKFSNSGFSLYYFKKTGPEFKLDQVDVGAGTYPTMSLLNHSCYPNAMPSSYGRYYVLRASRALRVGEEVTVGYVRGSYLKPIAERQQMLYDRYQFECTCQPCEEEWPPYSELPSQLQIRCTACSKPVDENDRKCLECFLDFTKEGDNEIEKELISAWKARREEVEDAKDKIQHMMKVMTTNQAVSTKDIATISKATEVLENYVSPPSWILWDAKDTLELYFHTEKEGTFG